MIGWVKRKKNKEINSNIKIKKMLKKIKFP
jgi:hypothetical protein